jgi:hypothetical protein
MEDGSRQDLAGTIGPRVSMFSVIGWIAIQSSLGDPELLGRCLAFERGGPEVDTVRFTVFG